MVWSVVTSIIGKVSRKKNYPGDSDIDLNKHSNDVNHEKRRGLENKVVSGANSVVERGYIPKEYNMYTGFEDMFRGIKYNEISTTISNYTRDFIFGSDNFGYSDIDNVIRKTELLYDKVNSRDNIKNRESVETFLTLLNYLKDYMLHSGREQNVDGFKKYLFRENGVLTQKRLKDMRSIQKVIATRRLKERTNHKFTKGDRDGDNFNVFNASYSRDGNGRCLVNVNDNESRGMYTDYGRIYWNVFNGMFNEEIDMRKTVNNYLKRSITLSSRHGNAIYIKGLDWKKDTIEDYAKFLTN